MLKSMTGFSEARTQQEVGTIVWEIRSLNSRYLDLFFHVPELFRSLEPQLREIIQKYIHRGKLDCTLRYEPGSVLYESVRVHLPALNQLHQVILQLQSVLGTDRLIHFSDILRWPGVIQTVTEGTGSLYAITQDLFEVAVQRLLEQRTTEGQKLGRLIEERLDQVEEIVQTVQKYLPEILRDQRQKVLSRFQELQLEVDHDRLEQELVFWMQKIDISEELDRLRVHTEEVKRLLHEGEVVGRRLDFFMQELYREANTLGSKSASEIISRASIDLKVLIEQMREQIQNIE